MESQCRCYDPGMLSMLLLYGALDPMIYIFRFIPTVSFILVGIVCCLFKWLVKGIEAVSFSSPVLFTATVFYLLIFISDSVNINSYFTHLIDGKKRKSLYWIALLWILSVYSISCFSHFPLLIILSSAIETKNVNIALICLCLEMETVKTIHFTVVWICCRIWKLQGYVQIIQTCTSIFN